MEYKNVLLGFWGLAGLIFWAIHFWHLFKTPQICVPKKFEVSRNLGIRLVIFIIGTVAWISISISLMGPRKSLGFVRDKVEINDIFFVVDVSRSMLADDFVPNRLEVAKEKIIEFVNLRPKDRIGIITFSEKAFTLLPLSVDLDLVRKTVSQIAVGFLGSGTNIGDALGLAVSRGAKSMSKNKTIILLTDGVSNIGSITPTQAATYAKEKGIKIYTIGVGGSKDARIPITKNSKILQRIPGGGIDVKTLQQIAMISGGRSYVAQDKNSLVEVLKNLDKLERMKIELSGKVAYKEFHLIFLVVGVLLILLTEIFTKSILREGV